MKLIILFASFLACYSIPILDYGLSGRKIIVTDTGIYLISASSGKQIIIDRKIDSIGRRFIEITTTGPNIPMKKVRISDDNEFMDTNGMMFAGNRFSNDIRMKRDFKNMKFTQGDLVINIFKHYQGINIDDVTYLHLLNEIERAVQQGMISEIIYYLMENLDQIGDFNVDPYLIGNRYERITPTMGKFGGLDPASILFNPNYRRGMIEPNMLRSDIGLGMGGGRYYGDLGIGTTHLLPTNEILTNPGILGEISQLTPSNINWTFWHILKHHPTILPQLRNLILNPDLVNGIYQPYMYERGIIGGRDSLMDSMNIAGIPQLIL